MYTAAIKVACSGTTRTVTAQFVTVAHVGSSPASEKMAPKAEGKASYEERNRWAPDLPRPAAAALRQKTRGSAGCSTVNAAPVRWIPPHRLERLLIRTGLLRRDRSRTWKSKPCLHLGRVGSTSDFLVILR